MRLVSRLWSSCDLSSTRPKSYIKMSSSQLFRFLFKVQMNTRSQLHCEHTNISFQTRKVDAHSSHLTRWWNHLATIYRAVKVEVTEETMSSRTLDRTVADVVLYHLLLVYISAATTRVVRIRQCPVITQVVMLMVFRFRSRDGDIVLFVSINVDLPTYIACGFTLPSATSLAILSR